MIYYEADLIVEMKPEAEQIELLGHTKSFINRATVSFDHEPTHDDIKTELAERYPEVNLVEVLRVWDASSKAQELLDYYSKGTFHGD
tara:strand:- start:65 stop:325 length:261 start_codon:yes stop_codon:yes gene_type:complete